MYNYILRCHCYFLLHYLLTVDAYQRHPMVLQAKVPFLHPLQLYRLLSAKMKIIDEATVLNAGEEFGAPQHVVLFANFMRIGLHESSSH